MYDIEFFQAIYLLKNQIVAGVYSLADAGELLEKFEAMRNRNPYVFNIETTNYCNMSCVMCPRTTLMQRKNQWIDSSLFEKVLDQIVPHTPEHLDSLLKFVQEKYRIQTEEQSENHFYFDIISRCLTLHGYGEPLLDRYIVERIAACSRRNIPSYFSCTPANLTVEKAAELMGNGLGVLKFSMDALTDEKQQFYRGRHNDFTKSFQTILDILDMKAKRNFSTKCVVVMIEMNDDDEMKQITNEFVTLWQGKDIYHYIKTQDNRWYYKEDEKTPNRSHYATQYCEYPWLSLTVMANGEVVPCTQDYDTELSMGHAGQQSLADIWNGDSYQQLRYFHLTGNFPKGHKCNERCDLKKAYQCLSPTPTLPTTVEVPE